MRGALLLAVVLLVPAVAVAEAPTERYAPAQLAVAQQMLERARLAALRGEAGLAAKFAWQASLDARLTTKIDSLRAEMMSEFRRVDTRIDALDITILEGGGDAVGKWAKENGFSLTPDAPEILDFYAARSPIFMAARFDPSTAEDKGQEIGDGTPIHLTIPTKRPWVPLRILGLGKQAAERVQADVYLLTDKRPTLLPQALDRGADRPEGGMFLERTEPASASLVADLRSDKGMDWIPADGMWLSYLRIDADAAVLTHDLAIDPTGEGTPSATAAGLPEPARPAPTPAGTSWYVLALSSVLGAAAGMGAARAISNKLAA